MTPHTRPAYRMEAAANFRLAAPLIAAQITFIGTGVIDTIMAGHLGERELAAVAVGSNIWMQLFVLFMGICMACSPIVAQRVGGGQAPLLIGTFVRQAVVIAAGLGLLWLLLLRQIAPPVIGLLGLSPETADLAHRYILAEGSSALAFSLCFVLRSSAEGLGLSRVVLIAGLAALAAKFIANWCFVYGHAGFTVMGAVGLGWGTLAASLVMLLVYIAQYLLLPSLRALQVFRAGWPRLSIESLEVLKLGLPIGAVFLAEAAFFGCTGLLMARFGDAAVAAHQIALNVTSFVFMVPVGLALATTVRVGQSIGAGNAQLAALAGRTGMLMGLGFALFSASLIGLGAGWISLLYTRSQDVAGVAQTFLVYAALFQVFDCLQSTASGALRGIKDARAPMALTIFAYWVVGLPSGYALAFTTGHGPQGLWGGFIIGLGMAAAGLVTRFLRKSRRLAQQADGTPAAG